MDIPDDWQTFRDPFGLYTVRFPPQWEVTGGITEIMGKPHENHNFVKNEDLYAIIGATLLETDEDRHAYAKRLWIGLYRDLYPKSGNTFCTSDAVFSFIHYPPVLAFRQHLIVEMIFDSVEFTNPAPLEVENLIRW